MCFYQIRCRRLRRLGQPTLSNRTNEQGSSQQIDLDTSTSSSNTTVSNKIDDNSGQENVAINEASPIIIDELKMTTIDRSPDLIRLDNNKNDVLKNHAPDVASKCHLCFCIYVYWN